MSQVLIDTGALLVLNDFDNILGEFFLIHLSCLYNEIEGQDSFLTFEVSKRAATLFYYSLEWMVIFFNLGIYFFYIRSAIWCSDEDELVENMIENKKSSNKFGFEWTHIFFIGVIPLAPVFFLFVYYSVPF